MNENSDKHIHTYFSDGNNNSIPSIWGNTQVNKAFLKACGIRASQTLEEKWVDHFTGHGNSIVSGKGPKMYLSNIVNGTG